MKVTVNLQEPFTYAFLPMVVIGILVLIGISILIVPLLRKRLRSKKPTGQKQIEIKRPKDIMSIKRNFIMQLNQLENALAGGQISTRDAYQKMSVCIRAFVYEVTGIEVLSYTLQDIKRLNMPLLQTLIEEYYAPEFAPDSVGDAMTSIQKTKRAIERWS